MAKRGNGDGSIFILKQKKNNPYAVRITVGYNSEGKQIFKYLGYYPNKTAAKKALNEFLVNPYDLTVEELTLQDIWDKWSENHRLSESAFKNYRTIFNRSVAIKNKKIRDVTLIELETTCRSFKASMQNTFRNVMKALYKYSLKHDLVDKNLADLIEVEKTISKEKEPVNKKDIPALLKHDISTILLYTGMRIGELISLEIEMIDLEKRIILLEADKTKSKRARRIPIHKEIIPILERLIAKNKKYVVTSKTGRQLNYSRYSINEWKDITKDYTLHQLRHTFVSRAMALELNKEKIQSIVGHKSSVTENVYTHYTDEDLIEIIDKFHY